MVINLKNKWWIILIIIIVICIFIGIYYLTKKNNNSNNTVNRENTYISNKTSTSNQSSKNNSQRDNTENSQNQILNTPEKEEIISSFSTKIYSKDSARQNNITITCSTLNNTVVNSGSTFSFCNTVGQATSSKGYMEADIFDNKGNKKKGLGGGNCQVSTTLYNAVLTIPSLVVIERHEHSNKVPYIKSGKDAAVAYGSYDLKFRNDTGYNIKINASNTNDSVNITLYKIY